MNGGRVWAIARKQFLALRHDHRTLGLMLVAPIMAMLIFGFAFGSDPKHVPVTVVNAGGPATAVLVDNLDHEALNLTTGGDAEAARAEVRAGRQVAAIIVPAPTRSLQPTPVEVYLDTTNQQLAAVVPQTLAKAVQALGAAKGGRPAVALETHYAFPKAKDARFIDYFVPGVMAFAITLFTTLLTLLAFVGERTSGTLDRLRSTPATEAEVVLGYELAFGTIAALQGLLILVVAMAVYHVLIVGPVALAALLIILTAIDAQAIGILISAAARREGQAVQFLPFIVFPVFLLSGIFVPVQSLPPWLQPLSYLLPPTWAVAGLRDVLLRGWELDRVGLHVAVLAGFAVVFTVLAIVGLRRSRA